MWWRNRHLLCERLGDIFITSYGHVTLHTVWKGHKLAIILFMKEIRNLFINIENSFKTFGREITIPEWNAALFFLYYLSTYCVCNSISRAEKWSCLSIEDPALYFLALCVNKKNVFHSENFLTYGWINSEKL